MKTKSRPNIKQTVLQQFPFLPDTFRGNDLVKLVKLCTGRRYLHSDTPLRKMRKLKAEGKLNYICDSHREESLYTKVL